MPGYKGHLTGGVFFWCCLFVGLYQIAWCSLKDLPLTLFATLGGSLFPDVDTKSKGQRLYYPLFVALALYAFICRNIPATVGTMTLVLLPQVVAHRSWYHNLLFISSLSVIAVITLVALVPDLLREALFLGIFFIVGATSHLALDFRWWRKLRL
jgi:hypothetical protein